MRGHSRISGTISTVRLCGAEIMATARRFAAFALWPSLLTTGRSTAPLSEAVWLFAVTCGLMLAASVLLLPLMVLGDARPSPQIAAAMAAAPLSLIVSVVILGPLVEELAFRSWLSGTRQQLVAGAGFVLVLIGGRWLAQASAPSAASVIGYATIALAIALYLCASRAMRAGPPEGWFIRWFPAIFWANVLGFGLLHVSNYAVSLGPLVLAFTLPQILAGAVFGYARLRLGLAAAIGLHMAFNAVPVTATLMLRALD